MLKEVEVRIGTKFVHLPYVDGAVANYLNDLCQKLTHTQTFTNYRGEQVTTEGDTFYYKSESGTEFRFPICMREEVLYRLEGNMSPEQIKVTKVEPEFGDDVSIELWDKFTYKEGQENFVDFLVDQQHNTRILPAVMGAGKCLLNGTPVRTPAGWTAIDKLKEGDVVIGGDGEPTTVIGVYPNRNVRMYKITTHDGREVIACEDHQWQYKNFETKWVVGSTKDMIKTQTTYGDVYLPNSLPVILEEKELELDPRQYGRQLRFDQFSEISSLELYKEGSIEQRKSLLDGLFSEDRVSLFYTHNQHLATEVIEVIRSVGGIGITEEVGTGIYKVTYFRDRNPLIRIKSIEEYGYHDGTCISVDNESKLFITKDYIVTHNTVSALVAISRIGKRAVIFIKPRYQSTWFKDMSWLLPNEKEGEDYIWVSGGDELKALINKAVNKEPLPKIVLISAPTFQTYVNKHNSFKLAKNDIGGVYKTQQLIVEDYNGVGPEDFFRVCGFGTKTVDEAHEEMAYNAVLDSFNPLFNNLYLTATLEAEHGIKKEMQEKVYPRELRCKVPPPVKHVHMVGVNYRLDFFAKPLKHKSPMGYSHVTFEKSLMTQPKRRNEYFKMITRLLLEYGREGLENGHKVLIWFSTKNMITAYLKYLKPLVGDKYQVVQYVAGTSKDALKADIIISTPGRSSTGLDLPGLCTCINSIAASSKNLNLQMFGRIRQLKEGVDLNPYYVYPYTQDIQKHTQYHKKRKQDHQDWYLTFSERFYPERI